MTQKDPVSLGSHANRLSSNLEAEISNYVIAQLSQILYVDDRRNIGLFHFFIRHDENVSKNGHNFLI